ncbi:hypothetical protein [Streptomyces sp. DASNCL29]|uniref:hypothetical protein n=1 Tax=Streptomyces sp. DASNCL29 TaxID=2583819 RepID=UPI00110FEA01|nr:hypothetical protein [Streptomyces sp. DASNCL29]TMU94805.1 hypothetical protein FGK60_37215 [Streptomyces sp. DASNCL29]
MSRTLPRSTAAKRRGVVLAVAAGALALGAAAPASASASPSSSASAAAAKAKTSHGPTLCVIRADDDSATPTTPTTPTKPGKVVDHAKTVKLTEAGKVTGKKAIAASKGRSHGRDDICVIPAFPTHPGKTCEVVVIKRGSGKADSVPTLPAKPGKHTTPTTPAKPGKPVPTKPGKPGKPGKTCVIVLPKDGHRATKSSADAKTAAVEATRATRS